MHRMLLALPLVTALSAGPAFAGLVDVTKNQTVAVPGGMLLTAVGQGRVFATADSNAVQVFDNPPSTFFTLNGGGNALNTITADALLGDYRGTAKASAGTPVGAGGVINVPVTLSARVAYPDVPPPLGGFALAISSVKLKGTVTVNSLTVNKITINKPAEIAQVQNTARTKGAVVLDPVHVTALNMTTGELIDDDVYTNAYTTLAGGSIGFNSGGLLELGIPEGEEDAMASFDSKTLVSYATDLTGSAKLEDGVLTATGVLNPDPSLPLSTFWSLVFSSTNPAYIIGASFLNSSLFDTLEIAPTFASPSTSDGDMVELGLDMSLQAIQGVPEPEALLLLGIGALLLMARRGTVAGRANPPPATTAAGFPRDRPAACPNRGSTA